MPDRGTRNAIFVLRRLVERPIQKQKDVFTCFIDYSKAFDTVKHASLFDLLSSLDIDSHDIQLLANLYWNQQAAVRYNGEVSESVNIKQGIRQGCVASPHLFALYTEMIMRNIEGKGGFRVGDTVINNLRYADDTVIIADTEEELQQLIDIVVRESENKGLYLNGSNSFTMVFSKSTVIMLRISYKDKVTNEEGLRRAKVDRTLMKDIVKRQMEFFGHVIRKEELENLVVTGFIEGKRARGEISDLSAKDEGNDAHRTDPPCLRERCLVTVVQIAAYVNMIWHTMMMMKSFKSNHSNSSNFRSVNSISSGYLISCIVFSTCLNCRNLDEN